MHPASAASGFFGSVEEALPALTPASVDVVLMDLALPGMSGIEGIRVIKDQHPSLKLVALTVYEDDDRIFEALCAGASGYLLKKTPPPRFFECLQEVVRGGAPMSPEVAAASSRSSANSVLPRSPSTASRHTRRGSWDS